MLRVSHLTGFGGASPDVTAPTITSASSVSVAENATLSFTVTTDESATLTIGGADAAQVELASNTLSTSHTLRWSSNGTRDFESPADAGGNNVYDITITPTDAALNTGSPQSFAITVTNVVATWNASDKSSNIDLSNGNLTATANASANGAVRANSSKTSGKYYVEYTCGAAWTSGANNGVGIALASATLSTIASASSGASIAYKSGAVWFNGSSSAKTIASTVTADVICMAVDLDNKKIWFRKNNGNWFGDAAANPATNTNGLDITAIFPGAGALPAVSLNFNTSAVTVNFGASGFAQSVPSGFTSGWPE